MPTRLFALGLLIAFTSAPASGPWVPLFNGKNLDGWEAIGSGVWTILAGGTLVGQRDLTQAKWLPSEKENKGWRDTQAWLYTVKEYDEFDLRLEYWARYGGNSGVSIRDTTRAKHGVITPPDFTRTPSKLGYEIQISNHYPDKNPTGSIYNLAIAKTGAQKDDQWNTLEIQSRKESIRVLVNGQLVAEHAGDPARPKTGPIGLQLHDQYSVVMFRNIKLRTR